jgi:UDP-2,3-diacylglucosamine hydrolase
MVAPTAKAIFIVGDLFEFWFEYRHVVPKGYVRILSKLAALKEQGIAVYVFTGNHDLWMDDYFETELGVPVFHSPVHLEVSGVHFLIGHGDGLGPGDYSYKLLKKVFLFPPFRWLFRWLHPDIGIKIANLWSTVSRTPPESEVYHGDEKEWILQYAISQRKHFPYDHFIFGHRHLPIEKILPEGGRYYNIGDWMVNFTYIAYNGKEVRIHRFM